MSFPYVHGRHLGTQTVLQLSVYLFELFQRDTDSRKTLLNRGIPLLRASGFCPWASSSSTIPMTEEEPLTLQKLETVGKAVLGEHPDGGGIKQDGISAPWNGVADPLMSCWRQMYGPVGMYWVFPMWLAMYMNPKDCIILVSVS